MNEQLTDWFSGDVKPVHIGIYKTKPYKAKLQLVVGWQYWNGKNWGGFCHDKERASQIPNRTFVSAHQSPIWRGIAK